MTPVQVLAATIATLTAGLAVALAADAAYQSILRSLGRGDDDWSEDAA